MKKMHNPKTQKTTMKMPENMDAMMKKMGMTKGKKKPRVGPAGG